MDRKNEALNYLKQYPKMDEYLHGHAVPISTRCQVQMNER